MSESMHEWQPARLKAVHSMANVGDPLPQEEIDLLERRVVRVKAGKPSPNALREYRADGCDAKRFFFINPEDLKGTMNENDIVWVCEHEILTD